jgi:hypothetical protein
LEAAPDDPALGPEHGKAFQLGPLISPSKGILSIALATCPARSFSHDFLLVGSPFLYPGGQSLDDLMLCHNRAGFFRPLLRRLQKVAAIVLAEPPLGRAVRVVKQHMSPVHLNLDYLGATRLLTHALSFLKNADDQDFPRDLLLSNSPNLRFDNQA